MEGPAITITSVTHPLDPAPELHDSGLLGAADIWRPYLHPAEYSDMTSLMKLDNPILSEQGPTQDNFFSFMLRGSEQEQGCLIKDTHKILANVGNSGLQLTKL